MTGIKHVSEFDVEHNAPSGSLFNSTIKTFSWHDITVTVDDRQTKQPKDLLHNVSGEVKAGKVEYH